MPKQETKNRPLSSEQPERLTLAFPLELRRIFGEEVPKTIPEFLGRIVALFPRLSEEEKTALAGYLEAAYLSQSPDKT